MVINSENLAGLRTTFSAAFNKAYLETPSNKDKIATTIPSSTKLNTYGWLGDFPTMREWIGEREIQNLEEKEYNIVNKHYEATVSVNRDDVEDDNLGIYTVKVQMMGNEARFHQDILVMSQMKNGFTGTCYDDKPFFAENHPVGDGTYSNKGTAKLTPESYAAARASMMSLTKDNGDSANIRPNLLVVPPTLEAMARRILEAEMIEGTTNPWKGSAELLIDSNLAWGTYENNWFLLDTSKPLKPMIFQERKKTKFVSKVNENDDNVFFKNEYVYGADGRYNAGYGFWQFAYGSTGEQAG